MFIPPPLYAIANLDSHSNPLEFVAALLGAGSQIVQLRTKTMPETALIELTKAVLKHRDAENSVAKIIVNDSWSVCLHSGADGLHLGQTDSDPRAARLQLGAEAIIGFSTHNLEQLEAASADALSYIALGPIFQSSTKSGHAPIVGLETLRRAVAIAPLPLVAIGGIDRKNAAGVFAAGAASVAVIADLERAENLPAAIKEYSELRAANQ